MHSLIAHLQPTATNMIRVDHTHVVSTFHQYKPGASPRVRKGLVATMCTALEIHAQLEEEIFYPAVREVTDDELIRKSLDEHTEMKRLIALLRQKEPDAVDYDETVMALMRDVLHHVADEETIVLPAAEHLLADELGDLGMRMTKRRLQLVAPRSGEIAMNMGRAVSSSTAALSVTALAAVGLVWAARNHVAGRHVGAPAMHR